MKFGGTSVGSPEQLKKVVHIIHKAARAHRIVVIASAASGVTDRLVNAWNQFDAATFDRTEFIRQLRERHVTLSGSVLKKDTLPEYLVTLEQGLEQVSRIIDRMSSEGKTEALYDAFIAMGERLSVPLVSLAVRDAGNRSIPVDSAPLIHTDSTFGEAVVDLPATFESIRAWYVTLERDVVPIVTGFIGSTKDGLTTTLGRGGSDYSAALLASGLNAAVMERWTDVDGIYTEDPRKSRSAKRLASIVLEEAWAWNQAGRLGMHRKALDPLVTAGIPVHVRSTAIPDLPGTLIVPSGLEVQASVIGL